MIWYLLVASCGAFLVFRGLGEVAVSLLLLLQLALEAVAGARLAGLVMLVVIVGGVGVGGYYLCGEPSPSFVGDDGPARAERDPRARPAPVQQASKRRRRSVSRCGRGDAPGRVDASIWSGYRCSSTTEDTCLPWALYATKTDHGCPRQQLCCPSNLDSAEKQEAPR